MTGVCSELEEWNQSSNDVTEIQQEHELPELLEPLPNERNDQKILFLENIDVLVAEHKFEEALEALEAEEKNSGELKGSGNNSSDDVSSYKSALSERKAMLEQLLVGISEQPSISFPELKKALNGLIKLGKGPRAHQTMLKFYKSHLQKRIEAFLPSSSLCPETFPSTLSKIVFSVISLTIKQSALIFGDNPVYTNRIVQWAEWEIEYFVRVVKENAPLSETVSALRAACICTQASLNYCSILESQGLKMSKLLLVLLRPSVEEVLESNFRRARRVVLDIAESAECCPLSPQFVSSLSSIATSSSSMLVESGMRFMHIVEEILEQLTPLARLHFGGNVLNRISQLFDKYMDALIRALPGPSDDDNLPELKEAVLFRAETDSEQLAILGIAFTILDELLPNAVLSRWMLQSEGKETNSGSTENLTFNTNASVELKEWRKHLQHSFDKLRDHFCRQYILTFIYSREGKTRLNAHIYLGDNREDNFWDSEPLPSLPFQALFAKLQQLAIVAGDVLIGKDKIHKILLARLTETVVMWLSDEQEFWGVLEDISAPLQPLGLQQLILDMHFTVEIARYAGYPSRHIHQIASAITARAIRTFSARGINPQSALPEDEWFVETAKSAIHKFLLGASGSEASDTDEDHIIVHDELVSDSDTVSSLSSRDSTESFASASMAELDSPSNLSDPDN
ncbi:exocyst complex component EXO84C [Vigna umbellata]|uniref:exocyst complex component EXO84C n=1 Tax=Vigna umbellata TaxID=87088 RepID=UPI001F5F754E|nr:exocyst complex component EXO84C [Vigna umbellata]